MSYKTHVHGGRGVAQRHSTSEAVERRQGGPQGGRGGKAAGRGECQPVDTPCTDSCRTSGPTMAGYVRVRRPMLRSADLVGNRVR